MSSSRKIIFGLAVILAAVIGFTIYRQQVPLKSTSEENKIFKNESEQLKTA